MNILIFIYTSIYFCFNFNYLFSILDPHAIVNWDINSWSKATKIDFRPQSKSLVFESIGDNDVGLYRCRLYNGKGINRISLEINKNGIGYYVTWSSEKMSPISLDLFSESDTAKIDVEKYIRNYGTELYIDCQSSAGNYN